MNSSLDVATRRDRRPLVSAVRSRLLCLRHAEILVLQAPPWMGVAFAYDQGSGNLFQVGPWFVFANLLLVAHTFALNDWADLESDSRDSRKATGTFAARGVRPVEIRKLWAFLGLSSLALFALLSGTMFLIAVVIVALGFFYSLGAKRLPFLSTLAHLGGGALHFLLGYSLLTPIDSRGVLISIFFGLTFAAGHLNQEVRDYAGDRAGGVRTHAVRFGQTATFIAGQLLFGLAYAHLILLASLELVVWPVGYCAAFYAFHLLSASEVHRAGLDFDSVQRFQLSYRMIYSGIGLTIVASLLR